MVQTEVPRRATTQSTAILGGFVRIGVNQISHAWQLCQNQSLGIAEFRAWIACIEILARRQQFETQRKSHFNHDELARLLGVSNRRARASIRRLEDAGIIQWSAQAIKFPEPAATTSNDLNDTIGQGRGVLNIPRRILRNLIQGGRPALIATTLGILLRCLSRRREGFDGRGRVKASWIAKKFGVDLRRVKAARQELIAIGWITSEPDDQLAMNRWGRAYRINLQWEPKVGRRLPPPEPKIGPELPPPLFNPEPFQEKIKNQDPWPGAQNSGVWIGEEPAENPKRSQPPSPTPRPPVAVEPVQSPVQSPVPPSLETLPEPKLTDIRPEDLVDTGRLLALHGQAVKRDLIGSSENDRLKFVAVAEYARKIGQGNPCGLLASLIRRKAWHFATQVEEDAARRKLRAYLHPAGSSFGFVSVASPPAAPMRRSLSEDARLVQEIKRSLVAAGFRGDPFPQVRRHDSSWTRARWDAALQEVSFATGFR